MSTSCWKPCLRALCGELCPILFNVCLPSVSLRSAAGPHNEQQGMLINDNSAISRLI